MRSLYHHNRHVKVRLQALRMIAGTDKLQCIRCGCDDVRLLEINHKNGGGVKDQENRGGSNGISQAIVSGRRGVEDLEILCRPCNAIDYLERRYGPLPMWVVWSTCQIAF